MQKMLVLLYFFIVPFCHAQTVSTPDKLYGQLFTDVQMSRIFRDSKTFVDCIPKREPQKIFTDYLKLKNNSRLRFSLKLFVEENFILPDTSRSTYITKEKTIKEHIQNLWVVLKRKSDSTIQGGSLLPLPYPYIVPGGRFREIYYWDSYFTMLGLKESGEYEMMQNMVNNFAYFINEYGHIPNGNRTYYLSRSQPPFFSLMVELLAEIKGDSIYLEYLPALEKEFNYWNAFVPSKFEDGFNRNKQKWWMSGNHKRLYRYYDSTPSPRQESFYEDSILFRNVKQVNTKGLAWNYGFRIDQNKNPKEFYSNIRSAAESGWDFSSRWLDGDATLKTIITSQISPIDLNCLIWHLGQTLSKAYNLSGKKLKQHDVDSMSTNIAQNLDWYFYDNMVGWYMDYDAGFDKRRKEPTLAGMYPLFFKLVNKQYADRAVQFLKKNFIKQGGVVTTLKNTGQQWDAPNGWAPLQWITIIGLENYGYHDLAKEIATHWFNLNKKVFLQTGKLMGKYDVINTNKPAGGGEYPSQDGFGWTNGVILALINKYNLK